MIHYELYSRWETSNKVKSGRWHAGHSKRKWKSMQSNESKMQYKFVTTTENILFDKL